jgi:putative ABC transport system ATP-binding protein
VTENIFTVRGLTKIYASGEVEVRALAGVDLDIAQGEIVLTQRNLLRLCC